MYEYKIPFKQIKFKKTRYIFKQKQKRFERTEIS